MNTRISENAPLGLGMYVWMITVTPEVSQALRERFHFELYGAIPSPIKQRFKYRKHGCKFPLELQLNSRVHEIAALEYGVCGITLH